MNTTKSAQPFLRFKRTVSTASHRYDITVELSDDCRNGHEDFSVTAAIYDKNSRRRDPVACGACHDEILRVAEDLAPFVALHLCDANGVPMHPAANGFYWYAGTKPDGLGLQYHGGSGRDGKTPKDCRRILKDHLRATDADLDALDKLAPHTELEFSAALVDLDFPNRWKAEAAEAIAKLEAMTGDKFETNATRSPFTPPTQEQRDEIARRRASGYYEPEQVAARAAEAKKAKREKKLAEIDDDLARGIRKLEQKAQVERYLVRRDYPTGNVIFYAHINTLSFNWNDYSRRWTREEFNAFVQEAEKHFDTANGPELPQDIRFELKGVTP